MDNHVKIGVQNKKKNYKSLQAHVERVNRNGEKKEEKAFHVKGESSNKEKTGQFSGRGKGRAG